MCYSGNVGGVGGGGDGWIPKQEHRMLTLETKILPLLLLGLKPMTFQFIQIFLPLLIKVDLYRNGF